jgi:hypothetical protein
MTGYSRLALLGLAAAFAAACSPWQNRADDLQQSTDGFTANGQRTKADFVARFGDLVSCLPAPSGESCEWRKSLDPDPARPPRRKATEIVRASFGADGHFVSGTVNVRHGQKTYQGLTLIEEEAVEDAVPGDCRSGETFQYGRCYATSPGGGPPPNSNTK